MPSILPRSARFRTILTHTAFSVALVGGLAFWVLTHWYPGGLLSVQGGTSILIWVIGITFVVGPILTAILFRPDRKGKKELRFDLVLILVLQLSLFAYGAWTLSIQRPIYLAFVYDRFFAITSQDVIGTVPNEVTAVPAWSNGPRPVFVKPSLAAQLEAVSTVGGFDEAPPTAFLAGGYAPLAEGVPRFNQMQQSPESDTTAQTSTLTVPVIGRAGEARAILDLKTGSLVGIAPVK
ncbi:hypothetical protein AZKH_3924 [Azoarcus sp. KH32C]|nr:hypothetical protein AZKH_3924 [Azoarcus sp. KH32C]